jgi:membrane-bound serine protease (ClpP class)
MSIGSALDSGPGEAVTNLPQLADLDTLKGRVGRTVSTMRPSGTVEFDGRRVDAMTEGTMLDAGVWVKCVEVKGGKVIVRRNEHAADVTDIRLDEPDRGDAPPARKPDPLDDFDLGLK